MIVKWALVNHYDYVSSNTASFAPAPAMVPKHSATGPNSQSPLVFSADTLDQQRRKVVAIMAFEAVFAITKSDLCTLR
jgi:hypothetical protein